ncbi:MAG: HPr family phosphocarrier protein [Chlorobiaceae bacterium]|nr:HPr family phosphocarrier protein [Chlorobiaceae bacterium]
MIRKHLTVRTPQGLHMRAAAKIRRISQQQRCRVHLQNERGEQAASESLVEMLSLGAVSGTPLQVTVTGDNAGDALAMIEEVFENGAGI